MRFFTGHLYYSTVAVATGTESASYLVTNLNSDNPRKLFITDAASTTDIYLTLNLGAARTCNYILLGNRGWRGNLSIDVGTTGSDNGTDYSLSVVASTAMIYFNTNEQHLFSSISRRYWRLRFEDFAAFSNYIGNISIGAYIDTPVHSEFGNYEIASYNNVIESNLNEHIVRSKVGYPSYYYTNIQIKNITRTQIDSFVAQIGYYTIGGLHNMFFSSPGYIAATTGSGNQTPMYYGRMSDISYLKHSKDCYDLTFNLYSYTNLYYSWTLA